LTTPAILRRRRDPAGDRLATAIFVAALAHGLFILGVRFSAPPMPDRALPTLEVLLVPSGPDDPQANLEAAYIAQRTQQGTGTGTEAGRASLPEARPEQKGLPDAAAADQEEQARLAEPEGAVSVLARRALEAERLATGVEPRSVPPVFYARPTPAVPTVGLNAAVADRELHLRGQRSADGTLLADTRESAIATYLDGWKRRIERVGTLNFPNEARRRQLSGNPVLEVAIRANGTLESVVVRRTSGHRELDNAAVGIVRLAAPFEPFSNALRERYPVLRFAYEWQFINGQLGGDGAVFTPGP
jgi:protein TonB